MLNCSAVRTLVCNTLDFWAACRINESQWEHHLFPISAQSWMICKYWSTTVHLGLLITSTIKILAKHAVKIQKFFSLPLSLQWKTLADGHWGVKKVANVKCQYKLWLRTVMKWTVVVRRRPRTMDNYQESSCESWRANVFNCMLWGGPAVQWPSKKVMTLTGLMAGWRK